MERTIIIAKRMPSRIATKLIIKATNELFSASFFVSDTIASMFDIEVTCVTANAS